MGNISQKSFCAKLAGYATLAVAGLATEPALAGVITSGPGFVPLTIAPGEVKSIDFGAGIGNVFRFSGHIYSSSYVSALIQRGVGGSSRGVLVPGTGNDPARLGLGFVINGGANWYTAGAGTTNDIAGAVGDWNGTGDIRGFLGIRFTSPGLSAGLHYGFFDVSYDNAPTDFGTMTIHGWAYEDVAEAGITTQAVDAVPEPATMLPIGLGLLALGAAGLRRKRDRAKLPSAA